MLRAQDDEWEDEEKLNQGFTEDEFAFLSDMIHPKGLPFDNDDVLDIDDEDLKNDPVCAMDMKVSIKNECSSVSGADANIIGPFTHLLQRLCDEKHEQLWRPRRTDVTRGKQVDKIRCATVESGHRANVPLY